MKEQPRLCLRPPEVEASPRPSPEKRYSAQLRCSKGRRTWCPHGLGLCKFGLKQEHQDLYTVHVAPGVQKHSAELPMSNRSHPGSGQFASPAFALCVAEVH